MSTIQAQDFKDEEGDKLIGRKTLPIVAPNIARPTFALALLAWSVALSMIWKLNTVLAIAYNLLGFMVAVRFLIFNGIKADQKSFYLYAVRIHLSFTIVLCH